MWITTWRCSSLCTRLQCIFIKIPVMRYDVDTAWIQKQYAHYIKYPNSTPKFVGHVCLYYLNDIGWTTRRMNMNNEWLQVSQTRPETNIWPNALCLPTTNTSCKIKSKWLVVCGNRKILRLTIIDKPSFQIKIIHVIPQYQSISHKVHT